MLATSPFGSRWTLFLTYTTSLLLADRSHGLDISYCSPDNNAGSYPAYYNEFQSNGACQLHCQGSYAFAVLQGYNCWCSNYIPADQDDTSSCDQGCPGIDTEWCGNTDQSLFGYYLLSLGVPIGTSGGSSATTALQTPSQSTPTAGASSSSSIPSSTSSFSSSPSPAPSPTEVYTSITTVTGVVRTVIITPTASPDATLGQSSTGGGGGVSTGKVVGIVLGVALGIGALIGIAIWIWFRRRHRHREVDGRPESVFIPRTGDTSPSNNAPTRQHSQLSSSGLLGSKIPRINTSGISGGTDLRSVETGSSGFDRRSVGTDQRLNPYALYIHDESRLSNVSLQDNQDYSRQLRVANPDP